LAKVSAQLVAAIIFQLYNMVDVQIECGWWWTYPGWRTNATLVNLSTQ
jgi:hypothetical protein